MSEEEKNNSEKLETTKPEKRRKKKGKLKETDEQQNIENIGKIAYFWIILTGKNRQFHKWEDLKLKQFLSHQNEEDVGKAEEWINHFSKGDMKEGIMWGDIVITISKKAIIVTISVPWMYDGQRVPIIVKRWREIKKKETSQETYFIDTDDNTWKYYKNQNKILCIDIDGNLLYKFT